MEAALFQQYVLNTKVLLTYDINHFCFQSLYTVNIHIQIICMILYVYTLLIPAQD